MEKLLTKNRKATFEYEILHKFQAGIVLLGHEVKSIKCGGGQMQGCFVTMRENELWVEHLHIAPYKKATLLSYDPERPRKLLVSKAEIKKITGELNTKGVTLIGLALVAKNGFIKVEFATARGKKKYDKRESIKRKDIERRTRAEIGRR